MISIRGVWRQPTSLLLASVATLALAACATPEGGTTGDTAAVDNMTPDSEREEVDRFGFPTEMGPAGVFAKFEPVPDGRTTSVDYSVITDALDAMVFNTGPSLRIRARRRDAQAGTRMIAGHESPYRLEGNKIFFSQFDDETGDAVQDYVDSLVQIGNQLDLTKLSKNEQLAYWYNLHNMVVISQIASNYPVQRPGDMRVGDDRQPLHDAKLVTIDGVALSLSDIRRNIIYRYWDDPRVMYGFFHGDLGSPNINDQAFTGSNVVDMLEKNAREFVNALRGVSNGSNTAYISKHYYEARPGLFPNWPSDLKSHLRDFAEEEVQMILNTRSDFTPMKYPDRTADLVGGEPRMNLLANGTGSARFSPALVEMVEETREKFVELRRQGRLGSRVIIIDVPTEDTGPETLD
jgi:hypothetical protein